MEKDTLLAVHGALHYIKEEMKKVIIGKDDVVEKILMSILADGHVLLDDVPGVGKTTLAVALGKVLGLKYNRIQFTPDVLPSDIVGFSIYNKETEKFIYMPGTVNNTNLLLADEINRTSSRTQAALLEAMEEKQVTVDGVSHRLNAPFIVIATQNQVGTAGTQQLPQAQLDRFLVRLSIGYPDRESQMAIIRERQTKDPFAAVRQVTNVRQVLSMQSLTLKVIMTDQVVAYISDLVDASRQHPLVELGISPRGAVAVSHMAKACALMHSRDYVTVEDVQEIFRDVSAHRILLSQAARAGQSTADEILKDLIGSVKLPNAI